MELIDDDELEEEAEFYNGVKTCTSELDIEDDDDTPPRRAILKSTSNLSCSPAASYSSNPV